MVDSPTDVLYLASIWAAVLSTVLCVLAIVHMRLTRCRAHRGDEAAARSAVLPALEPVVWLVALAFAVRAGVLNPAPSYPYPNPPAWFNNAQYLGVGVDSTSCWLYFLYWFTFETVSQGLALLHVSEWLSPRVLVMCAGGGVLSGLLLAGITTFGFNYQNMGLPGSTQRICDFLMLGLGAMFYIVLLFGWVPRACLRGRAPHSSSQRTHTGRACRCCGRCYVPAFVGFVLVLLRTQSRDPVLCVLHQLADVFGLCHCWCGRHAVAWRRGAHHCRSLASFHGVRPHMCAVRTTLSVPQCCVAPSTPPVQHQQYYQHMTATLWCVGVPARCGCSTQVHDACGRLTALAGPVHTRRTTSSFPHVLHVIICAFVRQTPVDGRHRHACWPCTRQFRQPSFRQHHVQSSELWGAHCTHVVRQHQHH